MFVSSKGDDQCKGCIVLFIAFNERGYVLLLGDFCKTKSTCIFTIKIYYTKSELLQLQCTQDFIRPVKYYSHRN